MLPLLRSTTTSSYHRNNSQVTLRSDLGSSCNQPWNHAETMQGTHLQYIPGRQETTRWEDWGTHTYSTYQEDKRQPGGKLREHILTVHTGKTRDNQLGNWENTYLRYILGRQETTRWEAEGTHTYGTCREDKRQPGGKLREHIPTVHTGKTRDNEVRSWGNTYLQYMPGRQETTRWEAEGTHTYSTCREDKGQPGGKLREHIPTVHTGKTRDNEVGSWGNTYLQCMPGRQETTRWETEGTHTYGTYWEDKRQRGGKLREHIPTVHARKTRDNQVGNWGNAYLQYMSGRQETTRWEAEGTHTYSTCREDKGQPGGKLREHIPTVHAGETRDNQVGSWGNAYPQYMPGRQETTRFEAEGTHTYSTCREDKRQPGWKLRERIPTVHTRKTRDNEVGNWGNTYLQYMPGRQGTTRWEAEGTHIYSTCRKTRDNQVGSWRNTYLQYMSGSHGTTRWEAEGTHTYGTYREDKRQPGGKHEEQIHCDRLL